MNIMQWLYQLGSHLKSRFKKESPQMSEEAVYFQSGENTTYSDWVEMSEQLHPFIRKLQFDISQIPIHALNFDLLGASTYLLQIDLCLSKNRKYFDIYQKRADMVEESEKAAAMLYCQEAYSIMEQCWTLLKEGDFNCLTLPVKALSDLARLFEKQTQEAGEVIQVLNNTVLKKGALYQVMDSDLFKALYSLEQAQGQLKPYLFSPMKESSVYTVSVLRKEAEAIKEEHLKKIAESLIKQYESLSKYMIFSSSEVLNKAFKTFYNEIENFVQEAVNPKEDIRFYTILSSIFREVESIRFITNKKDAFTKNLQEAAKVTSKQLRKSLESSDLGRNFLNVYHKMNAQEKLDMKSRFK